jgi:CheY-like chemotaxis protein
MAHRYTKKRYAKSGTEPRAIGKRAEKSGEVSIQAETSGQAQAAPRILIADDEPAIAEAIALIVAEVGYVPVLAPDGQQALALARSTPPDLVITDLRMPRLDGAQLIAALRNDAVAHGRRTPPMVLMTAFRPVPDRALIADAFLLKPFAMTDVLLLLERFLPASP